MTALFWAVSCSDSDEATTREAQEREFVSAFGVAPTAAVGEIKAADAYSRGMVDGSYRQWMRFDYTPEVWSRLTAEVRNYQPRIPESEVFFPPEAAEAPEGTPSWFVGSGKSVVAWRYRDHEGTPENEGFSFREWLWHDGAQIYFQKDYWD